MLTGRFCRTVCVAGVAGTILLAGCNSPVDKSGPAVAPQNMDPGKQQQYSDFMKGKQAKPAAPGKVPGDEGGAPGAPAAPAAARAPG
jgi:hypothetical protein